MKDNLKLILRLYKRPLSLLLSGALKSSSGADVLVPANVPASITSRFPFIAAIRKRRSVVVWILIFLSYFFGNSLPFWVILILFILTTFLLVRSVFGNTVKGFRWSVGISRLIMSEQAKGTYDLLCMTALGLFGAQWLIAASYLKGKRVGGEAGTSSVPRRARRFVIGLFISVVILLSILGVRLFPETYDQYAKSPGLLLLISLANAITLTLAFILEAFQSYSLSSLCGMLAPTYTEQSFNAQFVAISLYAVLQLITYTLTLLIGFVWLPQLYRNIGFNGWLADMSLPIARLAIFYLPRETFIFALWIILNRRLGGSQEELDLAIRLKL